MGIRCTKNLGLLSLLGSLDNSGLLKVLGSLDTSGLLRPLWLAQYLRVSVCYRLAQLLGFLSIFGSLGQ